MTKKLNDCYYSPGNDKHECCTHPHYCIFNEKRTQLEKDIHELETKLTQFENIKNSAINGEIIYHNELDSYYDINVDVYTGSDGETHYKTDVKVKDNFINAVNLKIENIKYDLKGLVDFRLDVIHGKIGGYGHGV